MGEQKHTPLERKLIAALRKIERWQLPKTKSTWGDGTPVSYEAAYGSNGARDFIRGIARTALSKASGRAPTNKEG